jgi:hypothetical protein
LQSFGSWAQIFGLDSFIVWDVIAVPPLGGLGYHHLNQVIQGNQRNGNRHLGSHCVRFRWWRRAQPALEHVIVKSRMGWVFNNAPGASLAYSPPQHLDTATIEWMAGQHYILFFWLRPNLTILLILRNVIAQYQG